MPLPDAFVSVQILLFKLDGQSRQGFIEPPNKMAQISHNSCGNYSACPGTEYRCQEPLASIGGASFAVYG